MRQPHHIESNRRVYVSVSLATTLATVARAQTDGVN